MPGSPPTSVTAPSTRPPPRTRSRFGRFVVMRGAMSDSIASIGIGAPTPPSAYGCGAAFAISSCANEFQALQSGQRPSHFGDWLPHSVHANTAFFLGTIDCSVRLLREDLVDKVPLFAHRVRFGDPAAKLHVEIAQRIDAEVMDDVPRRERFDLPETRMLNASRQDEVAEKIVVARRDLRERHADVKRDARLLRQDVDRPARANGVGERVEERATLASFEVRVDRAESPTRVRLI